MCLSSSTNIKSILGGKIATSKHSVEIQKAFGKAFNEGTEFKRNISNCKNS